MLNQISTNISFLNILIHQTRLKVNRTNIKTTTTTTISITANTTTTILTRTITTTTP